MFHSDLHSHRAPPEVHHSSYVPYIFVASVDTLIIKVQGPWVRAGWVVREGWVCLPSAPISRSLKATAGQREDWERQEGHNCLLSTW